MFWWSGLLCSKSQRISAFTHGILNLHSIMEWKCRQFHHRYPSKCGPINFLFVPLIPQVGCGNVIYRVKVCMLLQHYQGMLSTWKQDIVGGRRLCCLKSRWQTTVYLFRLTGLVIVFLIALENYEPHKVGSFSIDNGVLLCGSCLLIATGQNMLATERKVQWNWPCGLKRI